MVRVGKVIHQAKILKKGLYHYVVNMESASQKWREGLQQQYINSVKKVECIVDEIDNPIMRESFWIFVQDVMRVILLKDVFNPDNKISWKERKKVATDLVRKEIVKKAIEHPYSGSRINRVICFWIKKEVWSLVAISSFLYFKILN